MESVSSVLFRPLGSWPVGQARTFAKTKMDSLAWHVAIYKYWSTREKEEIKSKKKEKRRK